MDKLAEMVYYLIDRWTSESPEKYKKITNIALIVGILSSIVLTAPVAIPAMIIPAWVIPIAAFFISLSSKMTKKSEKEKKADEIKENLDEMTKN